MTERPVLLRSNRNPVLEGLGAGLAFAAADLLASGPWNLPGSLVLASLGLGLVLGHAGSALGAWRRRPGLATGLIVALGLSLEGASIASKELAGAGRLLALAFVGACALTALLLAPRALKRQGLALALLLAGLVPASALVRPVLGAGPWVAILACGLPPLLLLWMPSRPLRLPVLVGLGLFVAVALMVPAMLSDERAADRVLQPYGTPHADAAGRPSVVLLVIDTLRADAPSASGALEALAAEGASFRQCISAAPWTLPSVASILTGLVPSQHGAVSATTPLAGELTTWAEHLRGAGYATAAFTGGAFVGRAHGLHQGFELFDSGRERRFTLSLAHVPLVWRLAKNRYLPLRTFVGWVDERAGLRGVLDGALEFARQEERRPLFLFLHTYQVHDYYLYDPDTDDRAEDQAEDRLGPLSARFAGRLTVPPSELLSAAQGDLDHFRGRYLGRVSAVEALLGEMRRELDPLLGPDAIWIVTSDHGEGFDAARGRVHHGGRLHDDLLHVPLVVRAPGHLPAGTVVEAPVRTVDLLPTVLELVGLPIPEGLAGESLLGAVRGLRPFPPLAFAEELEHGLGLRAARSEHWKLVRGPEGQTLFDLMQSPEEVAPSDQARPLELERALEDFTTRFPPRALASTDLDPATLEHLRELGYVE